MLERLQNSTSVYNTDDWSKDRKRNEKILKGMCVYPHILGKNSKKKSIPKTRANHRSIDVGNFSEGLKLPNTRSKSVDRYKMTKKKKKPQKEAS